MFMYNALPISRARAVVLFSQGFTLCCHETGEAWQIGEFQSKRQVHRLLSYITRATYNYMERYDLTFEFKT